MPHSANLFFQCRNGHKKRIMKHLDQHWLFKEYKDIGFLKGKLCRIHSYPRETCAVERIELLSTFALCELWLAMRKLKRRVGGPYPVNGVRWILLFSDFRLRRPATKDAGAASASLCGERSARHRGVIRHRHEGIGAGGKRRDVNVIGNIREGDSPRFWSAPRFACFHSPFGPFVSSATKAPYLRFFSRTIS